MRERFGHTATWILLAEDLPDEANHVELSATLADSSGIVAPKVVYRLADNTHAMIDWNVERVRESFAEAGARRTEVTRYRANGHFMGTARMGTDPRTSVVDPWGMAHDVANLGIVDGSVFVTVGAANPTSTICALALRAADHLLEHRASIPTPEPPRSFAVAPTPTPAPATPVAVTPRVTLDTSARERFAALADALIPAAHGMPGAADVDIAGVLLDRVLAARPDLAPVLERALSEPFTASPDGAQAHLDVLTATDRAAHQAVVLAVAGGYYLHDGVRRGIGYPGQLARTVNALDYPEYLAEGLLDGVLERGCDPRGWATHQT